jgi:phosphoribosylanthranilate isomerase
LTRIKICGITNVEDARCAAEAGVDFLGFIFYPKSPRFVRTQQAVTIARAIRDEFGAPAPRFVGVFVDEPVEGVCATLEAARLDLAQLHGTESAAVVRALYPRAFKAIRPQTHSQAKAAMVAYGNTGPDDDALPQLLVDAYHPQQLGGTGMQADLVIAQWLARRVRLLLAGGLTPETVGAVVEQVQPWGVDVSSGVERTKGIKDHARVRAFVEAVRAAQLCATFRKDS